MDPPRDVTTVAQALARARERLASHTDSAALDAELLLGQVLALSRAQLLATDGSILAAEASAAFEALLIRRLAGEPVAYLTGRRGFWSLELEVSPAVLVPRPETELLVEMALERLPAGTAAHILDLGTGSGAIALALASELHASQVDAVEASAAAAAVARRNAARLQLGNVAVLEGDWFEPVNGRRYRLIVGNPPYLAADDPHLGPLACEPRAALVAGPSGLESVAAIIAAAPRHLDAGGWLLLEHGATQGLAVRRLFDARGFGAMETRRDLAGLERATAGRWIATPAAAIG